MLEILNISAILIVVNIYSDDITSPKNRDLFLVNV